MLMGLHIGDSLGATLEFGPAISRDNFHKDIIGGGVHNWTAGAPTDDTELMLLLFESLIEHNGQFDPSDFSGRLMYWFISKPADMGRTTSNAITRMIEGLPKSKWPDHGTLSQGNGSLMRVTTLVLFPYDFELVKNQASVTHGHINCVVCDYIFINALKDALNGLDKLIIYKNALSSARDYKIVEIISHLELIYNLSWENLPTSGWCVHSLGAALWSLLNTDNFEVGLIEIVNRGDDSDTTGAITGALLGAYYGPSQIPDRWQSKILMKNKILELLIKYNNIAKYKNS